MVLDPRLDKVAKDKSDETFLDVINKFSPAVPGQVINPEGKTPLTYGENTPVVGLPNIGGPPMQAYAKKASETAVKPGVIGRIARSIVHPDYRPYIGGGEPISPRVTATEISKPVQPVTPPPVVPVSTNTTLPIGETAIPPGLSGSITNITGNAYTGRTFEGPEGTASVGPVIPESWAGPEEAMARQGVYNRADATMTGLRQGVSTEFENRQQLATEARQRTESETASRELELQREAGIVPKTGMAEYEENVQKMREEALLEKIPEKGRGAAVEGVISAREATKAAGQKSYMDMLSTMGSAEAKAGAAIAVGEQKAGVEAAKLGIQAENVSSQIKHRNAQIQEALVISPYYKQMQLEMQGAKDANAQLNVKRKYSMQVIQDAYKVKVKPWQDRLALNPTDEEAQKKINQYTKDYADDVNSTVLATKQEGDIITDSGTGKKYKYSAKTQKWSEVKEEVIPSKPSPM